MALTPTVLTDAMIILNAVTISDHGNKVEVPFAVENEETTAFGAGWKAFVGGLKSAQLNITFLNDFVAANLDATTFALLGTVVTFEVRATSAARSTSNPAYTGSVLIDSWKPISGDVGKLATTDVSWPTTGAVTRLTA
jgi:hypothetical protein